MKKIAELKNQLNGLKQAFNNHDEADVKKVANFISGVCTVAGMLMYVLASQPFRAEISRTVNREDLSELLLSLDLTPFLLISAAAVLYSRTHSYLNSIIEPRTKEIAIQVDELSLDLPVAQITQEKTVANLPVKLIIRIAELMRAYDNWAKTNNKMLERNSDTIRHYFLAFFLTASFLIYATEYRVKLNPAAQPIHDLLFLMVSSVTQGISNSYTTKPKEKEIGVQADENNAAHESVEQKTENKKSTINWIVSSIFGKTLNSDDMTKNTLLLPKHLHQKNTLTK